jgi:hypothetical protein
MLTSLRHDSPNVGDASGPNREKLAVILRNRFEASAGFVNISVTLPVIPGVLGNHFLPGGENEFEGDTGVSSWGRAR